MKLENENEQYQICLLELLWVLLANEKFRAQFCASSNFFLTVAMLIEITETSYGVIFANVCCFKILD